jgi:hypothetical protein
VRRLLEPGWLLAPLLCAGLAFAQAPPPDEAAVEESGVEEETMVPADEAAEEEVAPAVEEESAEPEHVGYGDSTGTLQNMDDQDGLRISVRTGALRARRGFTPLEVTLNNSDPVPHSVRLSFQGYGSGTPYTTRSVELAPHQRLATHLLIPAPVSSGSLTVEGSKVTSRTIGIYLEEPSAIPTIVLGTSKAFEANTGLARAEDSQTPLVNARFLSVQDAPREMAAYVGYPVVLGTEDVASVPSDVWAALENYAAVGGSLVVGRPSRDVRQRLPMFDREPERNAWNAYGFGSVYLCQTGAAECGGAVKSISETYRLPLEPIGPPPRWETSRYALRDGLAPLLPNALVPLGRFLILIFLFSLVVGPGGLMLARRKGPVALLIGVPAVALLTCLIIIGDSVLGDGFVTHASRYSFTFLDRARDRLVTSSVSGYYANLAPDKVRIPSSAVLIAPMELEEWLVDVDWAGGGVVVDGFLPSRTYVEWGELAVVSTRARLVARKEGEGWKVQNALGASLRAGYVLLEKKWYALPELADGAEGRVTEVQGLHVDEAVHEFVSLPPGVTSRGKEDVGGFGLPLKEGGFMARLEGPGFSPLAALQVQLHEGLHYVRGQVDTP